MLWWRRLKATLDEEGIKLSKFCSKLARIWANVGVKGTFIKKQRRRVEIMRFDEEEDRARGRSVDNSEPEAWRGSIGLNADQDSAYL